MVEYPSVLFVNLNSFLITFEIQGPAIFDQPTLSWNPGSVSGLDYQHCCFIPKCGKAKHPSFHTNFTVKYFLPQFFFFFWHPVLLLNRSRKQTFENISVVLTQKANFDRGKIKLWQNRLLEQPWFITLVVRSHLPPFDARGPCVSRATAIHNLINLQCAESFTWGRCVTLFVKRQRLCVEDRGFPTLRGSNKRRSA